MKEDNNKPIKERDRSHNFVTFTEYKIAYMIKFQAFHFHQLLFLSITNKTEVTLTPIIV